MKKIIFCFPIILLFSNCSYYNYAVSKSNPNLIYVSSKNSNKSEYEFTSTLFYEHEFSKPFIIEIKHLSRSNGEFESIIYIKDFYPEKSKIINFDSIQLTHSYENENLKNGKIEFLAMKRVENEDEKQINILPNEYTIKKGEWRNYITYTKKYKLNNKPKKMTEYIFLEFLIDGEKQFIEYEFPLEYQQETTIWELLRFLFDTA